MNTISNRIRNLSESATLEMTRKSRELKLQGKNVINLSIGEPDFNTPGNIKEAGISAINENITHYTPVSGFKILREAIAEKLKRDNALDYSFDQIIVSTGAKQSIANALLVLVNPGDEVVVPAPYWVSYPEMIKMAEGKMVEIPTSIDNNFKVTPEQIEDAITEKTKVLMLNTPSNPTGSYYTKEELKEIAGVVERHPDIYVISDEIYEYINYSGKHESIAQFDSIKDRVVIINGVSKGYAMTGWRIGYMAARADIAKACDTLQGQVTSGASSIAQMAALEAMRTDPENSEDIKGMVEAFRKRRNLVKSKLDEIPGIKTNLPDGAFYFYPDVTHYIGKSDGTTTIRNDNDLCLYLLSETLVALVPGSAFGTPGYIRLSYATSEENLLDAIGRMKKALAKLN